MLPVPYNGLIWLKTAASIERDLIDEIGALDSSQVLFDLSRYNFTSRFRLSKISRGIHSKKFNDFIMSHTRTGRYPVLVRDIFTGKSSVSEAHLYDLSLSMISDPKLLKDFVVYALVKELEAANEIASHDSLPEAKAEQIEAMSNCFNSIYRNIFSNSDKQLREVLLHAIQTDSDIINLVKIQPKGMGSNAIRLIFGFAALFIMLYATAFFFIDSRASLLGIEKFFGIR